MAEAPGDWSRVAAWRREERRALLAARQTLAAHSHAAASAAIRNTLVHGFPVLRSRLVGFYWPFRREVDLRPIVEGLIAQGGAAALPVVVDPRGPLEFRLWRPGMAMASGVYDIPYPAEGAAVRPDALFVALLGFDAAGYRLGYGGGYYDRTLAAAPVKPLAIGVGLEIGRLATIYPQPHDIPMDYVVSDAGVFCRGAAGLVAFREPVARP